FFARYNFSRCKFLHFYTDVISPVYTNAISPVLRRRDFFSFTS
ncbi:8219_t:CDS:1, partial [Funneliformis mosseae]